MTDLDHLIRDYVSKSVERTVFDPGPEFTQNDKILGALNCDLPCCHNCNDLGTFGG